jgi:simple sugar transport system ATP-binding protein
VDLLAGIMNPSEGRIVFGGKEITRAGVQARLNAGIAYIPVDRGSTSLVPGMSIENNLALRDFARPPFRRGPWLNRAAFKQQATTCIGRFGIRCANPSVAAHTLSGGNQQKIVVAREIGRRPRVLLAYQPTWGLDPGAARFVIDQLLALRDEGGAILFVSSELEEVLTIGDRIGVMSGGQLIDVGSREAADLTQIGLLMAGALHQNGSRHC